MESSKLVALMSLSGMFFSMIFTWIGVQLKGAERTVWLSNGFVLMMLVFVSFWFGKSAADYLDRKYDFGFELISGWSFLWGILGLIFFRIGLEFLPEKEGENEHSK